MNPWETAVVAAGTLENKHAAVHESAVFNLMLDYDTSHEALMSCSQQKTSTTDLQRREPKTAHRSRTCSKRCVTLEP